MKLEQQVDIFQEHDRTMYSFGVSEANPPMPHQQYVKINSADYHGPTCYFQAYGVSTGSPAQVKLQYENPAGTWNDLKTLTIGGAEGLHTSSSFSLAAGDYQYRVRGQNCNIMVMRILIIDEHATQITKTITYIDIGGSDENIDSLSYVKKGAYWEHNPIRISGTVAIYFEACFYKRVLTAGTVYVALWDKEAGAIVSGSELSTTSTAPIRLRSGSISLTDARHYVPCCKIGTANRPMNFISAKLIIVQTSLGSSSYVRLTRHLGYFDYTNSASYLDSKFHQEYKTDDLPQVDFVYLDATLAESTAGGGHPETIPYTGYCRLYNVTDASQVVEVQMSGITYVHVRSADISASMHNNDVYDSGIRNSQPNYTNLASAYIIIDVTLCEGVLPPILLRRMLTGVGL